jgi:hypothetical protein
MVAGEALVSVVRVWPLCVGLVLVRWLSKVGADPVPRSDPLSKALRKFVAHLVGPADPPKLQVRACKTPRLHHL